MTTALIFARPDLLWLQLVLIPLAAWYIWKQRGLHAALSVSATAPYSRLPRSWRAQMRHVAFALRMAAIACLIVVLARPQTRDSWSTSSVEGTDIILAMDISTSMLAQDLKPNRFGAAKSVAERFTAGRDGDNMGLVIFAAESFSAVPMTTDRAMLANYIHELKMGLLADGTAIGDGLATSINRIRQGNAVSKSIILLTDGSNNTGNVAPLTAAEIAAKHGIKVYTVGIGTNGTAPFPQEDEFGRMQMVNLPVVIDEATLRKISELTGGKYFRATSSKVLADIFEQIDALEKTKMDTRSFAQMHDAYTPWAIAAMALYLLALLIQLTVLRTIP